MRRRPPPPAADAGGWRRPGEVGALIAGQEGPGEARELGGIAPRGEGGVVEERFHAHLFGVELCGARAPPGLGVDVAPPRRRRRRAAERPRRRARACVERRVVAQPGSAELELGPSALVIRCFWTRRSMFSCSTRGRAASASSIGDRALPTAFSLYRRARSRRSAAASRAAASRASSRAASTAATPPPPPRLPLDAPHRMLRDILRRLRARTMFTPSRARASARAVSYAACASSRAARRAARCRAASSSSARRAAATASAALASSPTPISPWSRPTETAPHRLDRRQIGLCFTRSARPRAARLCVPSAPPPAVAAIPSSRLNLLQVRFECGVAAPRRHASSSSSSSRPAPPPRRGGARAACRRRPLFVPRGVDVDDLAAIGRARRWPRRERVGGVAEERGRRDAEEAHRFAARNAAPAALLRGHTFVRVRGGPLAVGARSARGLATRAGDSELRSKAWTRSAGSGCRGRRA